MNNRNCTYKWYVEEQGNKKEVVCKGVTRSEIQPKVTAKGTFSVIWVEDDATGELREVFANQIAFPKGGNANG